MIKELRQFNAQTGELVDIEEPAIIDIVGGNPEMGSAPVLLADQCIQFAPGCNSPWLTIQAVHRGLDRSSHLTPLTRQCPQLGLKVFGALRNSRAPVRQTGKGVAHPFQIGVLVTEHTSIMQRTDRQFMRVVGPNGNAAGFRVKAQHKLARFQYGPVLLPEKRDQQLVLQIPSVRLPVYVEPSSVFRGWAPLQDV